MCEGCGSWVSYKWFLQSGLLVLRISGRQRRRETLRDNEDASFAKELSARAEAAGDDMSLLARGRVISGMLEETHWNATTWNRPYSMDSGMTENLPLSAARNKST